MSTVKVYRVQELILQHNAILQYTEQRPLLVEPTTER
jgi:hypothetical protein